MVPQSTSLVCLCLRQSCAVSIWPPAHFVDVALADGRRGPRIDGLPYRVRCDAVISNTMPNWQSVMCAAGGYETSWASESNSCFLREDVGPCMHEVAYSSLICGPAFLKRGRQLLFLAEGDVTKHKPLISSYSCRPPTRSSAL